MPAPRFVQEAETAFNTTTTPKTSAALTDLGGDVLLSAGVGEDGGLTTIVPTLTGEVFASAVNIGTTGSTSRIHAHTTTISSDGVAETVSVARTGTALWFGANMLLFRDSAGFGAAPPSAQSITAASPNLAITTTQENSAIVVILTDWGASDPTTWTWRTVNGVAPTIQTSFQDTVHYAFVIGYYPDAGSIGAKNVGVTNSITYTIAAVEIKGVAGVSSSSTATGPGLPGQFSPQLNYRAWF